MNKYLFGVRKFGIKSVLIFLCIILTLIGYVIYSIKYDSANSFLKFHNNKFYRPLNDLDHNRGFYGKVNVLLEKALQDRTDQPYVINNLDDLYTRLRFYYPIDTTNYLISGDDIRLIGYEPSPDDIEDVEFFNNSFFREVIQRQRNNLTQKYFLIEWNERRDSIIGITIDTNAYNLSLLTSNWQGTIMLNDAYEALDENVNYIAFGKSILPLFSGTAGIESFINYGLNPYDVDIENTSPNLSINIEEVYGALNQRFYVRLIFDGPAPYMYSLSLFNDRGEISLRTNNLAIRGYVRGQEIVHDTNVRFNLAPGYGIASLTVQVPGQHRQFDFIITERSPFSIASMPVAGTGNRISIDSSWLDLSTRQQIRFLESNLSPEDSLDSIHLSSNIFLSKYLEDEIKNYVDSLDAVFSKSPDDIFEMSMCLIDISTGEIIATPFYSNEFPNNNIEELTQVRNFNLIKHDIGSTFKPPLALAAALKYESLRHFELTGLSSNPPNIIGYPTIKYGFDGDSPKGIFWSGGCNRTEFLASSHDNYPIAMSMLALTEDFDCRSYDVLTRNWSNDAVNNLRALNSDSASRILYLSNRTCFQDISNSSFIQLLGNLYKVDARTNRIQNNTFYDGNSWRLLNLKAKHKLYSLYEDRVSLGTSFFGNGNADTLDFKRFELFVLGQGDNQWSNVKLAQAYGKVISNHLIEASFISCDRVQHSYLPMISDMFNAGGDTRYQYQVSTQQAEQAWSSFMTDWRNAVASSRRLLAPALARYRQADGEYRFYCKTGTPQENEKASTKVFKKGADLMWWDEGLFAFGICNNNENYPKGVAGVVYIKHLSRYKIKKGIESSAARDFLDTDIYRKILFYNRNRFLDEDN